jgi:sugar lactone lactonase YvrE
VGSDNAGNLYVTDASQQTVQKISSSGQVTLVAGASGQSGSTNGSGGTARFNQPGALVSAPDGSLSISDTTNDLIRSITTSGSVTTLAGTAGTAGSADGTGATARFSAPIGIARDILGVLYVADSQNHTIRTITTGGAVTTVAGTAGTAGSADGTGSAARFSNPSGVAIDATGNIYVADTGNHLIRKIGAGGAVTTLAGQAGSAGSQDGTGGSARFSSPGAVAVSSTGDIYVADTGNSTIRKVTAAGVVTTVAGWPGIAGLMDGASGNALFDHPEGLIVGTDGNLYIADSGNGLVRKVTVAGTATSLALTTGSSGSTSGSTGGSTGGSTSGSTSSSGSGGGALDAWFISALALAALLRARQRRR